MMYIGYIIVYLFFLYLPCKMAMHMFQQNRYHVGRYQSWLRNYIHTSYRYILFVFLLLCFSYGLYFVYPLSMRPYLLYMLILIFTYINGKVESEHEYRKPFVKTARVYRLMALFLLFYVIVLTICYLYVQALWIFMTPFMYFSPWIMILILARVIEPMENKIRNSYVNDAKEILGQYQNLTCIGITGSYGKTSVKHMIHTLLSKEYATLMTPGSYNNLMGITITIRKQLTRIHELFVCEMGADHVGEIETLMDFVEPQIGVVTSVGFQHLQTFGSIEAILHEKMQMIEKLPSDGIGFVNIDNEYIRSYGIQNTCQIIHYGFSQDADFSCVNVVYRKDGTTFQIVYEDFLYTFHTKLLGKHHILNLTCAIAVSHTLGISWEMMSYAVARMPYIEHRLQVREGFCMILDDAYNANPEGASCALEVLRNMPNKRFIITPGFIELKDQQEQAQYEFGLEIAESADVCCLVGKNHTQSIAKGLKDADFDDSNLYIVDSFMKAWEIVREKAKKEDCVLIENDLPDAFNS